MEDATNPTFAAVTNELDQVLAKLKQTNDPETRKNLFIEMRRLMAQLDDIVFGWKA